MGKILKNKGAMRKREDKPNNSPRPTTPMQNFFSDAFEMMGGGVDPKELLKPSEKPRDAFTRTFFYDEERLNDIILLISQYNEFKFQEHYPEFYDEVCMKLDGLGSIGGMRIKEYLQAMARVVVAEDTEISASYRTGGNWHKKTKTKQIKRDDDEQDDE